MRGILLLFLLTSASCVATVRQDKSPGDSPLVWLLALAGIRSDSPADSTVPSPAVQVSAAPSVRLPAGLDDGAVSVQLSEMEVPRRIGSFVPVGQVYEVGLNPDKFLSGEDGGSVLPPTGSIVFPEGRAELRFTYDAQELADAGLLEEFMAFYFDEGTQSWKQLESTSADAAAKTVTAYTSHFTLIVLTALAPAPGIAVLDPPPCVLADYPAGSITSSSPSSWTPRMTVIDSYFSYYQDRPYNLSSPAALSALGFEGALAIATCNGNPAVGGFNNCGPQGQHKGYTGTGYIQFTARTDMDVYVLYDVRGGLMDGGGLSDTSHDASWLSSFEVLNAYVETTDPGQAPGLPDYRVYRKRFLANQTVSLDGNRAPGAGPSIQTNYWVVIRPAGAPLGVRTPASAICTTPDTYAPPVVSNLTAIAGANQITLLWQNPGDPDHATTVVRSGAITPVSPAAGAAPSGSSPTEQSFVATGLLPATSYCFSVFALDSNLNYQTPPAAICAVTGAADADGDGLSDAYEATAVYPTTLKTNPGNANTDGTGGTDGEEVAAGTDPTNPDDSAPGISTFALTSISPTTYPVASFNLAALDNVGVTGWMLTQTNSRPLASHTGWLAQQPSNKSFSTIGSHNLYVWAKDAAGNVSSPFPPISVDVQALLVDRFAYVGGQGVTAHTVDPGTGALSQFQTLPDAGYGLSMHPSQNRLYSSGNHFVVASDGQISAGTGGIQTSMYGPYGRTFFSPSGSFAHAAAAIDRQAAGISNWRYYTIGRTYALGGGAPAILETPYSAWGGVSAKPTGALTPDGSFYYIGGNVYAIHPVTGLSTASSSGVALRYPVIAPTSRFLYAVIESDLANIRVYSIGASGGLSHLQTVGIACSTNMDYAFDRSGTHLYVANCANISVFTVNPVTGLLSTSPVQTVAVGATIRSIGLSPSDQFLYAASGATDVQGFRRNPATGQLTFIGAFAAGQTPTSIAFKGGPATNNAPIVHISPPDQSWVSAGQTVALSGAGSNDPDASHCIANPSNYVYAWTQVSGPPVAITNPASLSLASVTLNTAGAYTFQLQFTDDAGNCPGPAQTGTRTIVIHAGVQHTQAVPDSCSGPGAAPFPTAKFTAASTRQQQLGIMTGWWIAVRPAPTPFGWGWVSVPACQSDELEYNAAYAQCVSRAAQSVPFLPLWSQTQTQTCVTGTWRWWDYN